MIPSKAAKEGIDLPLTLDSLIARAFKSSEAVSPKAAKSDDKATKTSLRAVGKIVLAACPVIFVATIRDFNAAEVY